MAPYLRDGDGDWRSIAEQASNEKDSTKLMSLVAELCRALKERREKSQLQRHPRNEPRSLPAD